MRVKSLVALAVIVAAAVAVADDMLEDRGFFQPTFFAELQDVEVLGDRAYVFGVGGLAVIRILDPDNPVIIGRYEPPGNPYVRFYRGAVANGYGYGGARENLLMVIDLTPVSSPMRTDVIGEPGMSYEGCTVASGRLFACRHGDGLQILSLQDPATPWEMAVFADLTNAWDVEVRDGLAYIADGIGGLAIVDVSDPANPFLAGRFASLGATVDVALHGDVAVIVSGSAGLELVDISDPTAPVQLGHYNTSALAITVAVDGDRAYVADWDDIEVVDISVPTAPVAVGRENTPVRVMGLDARDNLVYVADWAQMRIYDFGPTARGDIELPVIIEFGDVPSGVAIDTTFTVANTGGGILNVTNIQTFDETYIVSPPLSFSLAPGESRDVPLRYDNQEPGFDVTFIRVDSDDTDESEVIFPVTGEPDPGDLELGDEAPNFALFDLDGTPHRLSQQRGRVVVLAFFANW